MGGVVVQAGGLMDGAVAVDQEMGAEWAILTA